MQKIKGFTSIEVLIAVAIVAIVGLAIMSFFVNNMGATEARGMASMEMFIQDNNIQSVRKSCAGDSDGDGYASCTVVTQTGEKIHLQCPSDFISTNIWGASSCKEVDFRMNMPMMPVIPNRQ